MCSEFATITRPAILRYKRKLQEEVAEYFADRNVEELADIVEVILALARAKGVDEPTFEKIRKRKAEEKGGFVERVFLVSVEES